MKVNGSTEPSSLHGCDPESHPIRGGVQGLGGEKANDHEHKWNRCAKLLWLGAEIRVKETVLVYRLTLPGCHTSMTWHTKHSQWGLPSEGEPHRTFPCPGKEGMRFPSVISH